jgi:hypothetical protein
MTTRRITVTCHNFRRLQDPYTKFKQFRFCVRNRGDIHNRISAISLTARVDDVRIIYCVAGSRSFGISKLKKPHIFSVISFNVRVQNCKKLCLYKNGRNNNFTFFWRARVCRPLLCLCRPFSIFENPESCRSQQARYHLNYPSP